MIPEDEKLKLKLIALKIFHSVQLSPSEWQYWEKFSYSEKSFLLTGDTANTLDFTQYHKCYNQVTPQPLEQHLPAQHHIPSGGALGGTFEDPVNWDIPEQAHDQP